MTIKRIFYFFYPGDAALRPEKESMFNEPQDHTGGGTPSHAAASARADAASRHRDLNSRYGTLPAQALLRILLQDIFPGRIALVSSFGTEAAVLLHLVSQVDRATPVLFLDTGQLFAETLQYRDILVTRLGLTDVRVLQPDDGSLREDDRDATLWRILPDHCCHLRKVVPLATGLRGFDAWITGRKRFQGHERRTLPVIEPDADGRIKVNPLAGWTPDGIAAYFARHNLPRHGLEADGYRSIGCRPCTDRVRNGEDPRAGRWRHAAKTECGIHRPLPPFSACF